MKFELMDAQKALFPVKFMCEQLGVSRSGYYAWQRRPESARQASDRALAEDVARVHQESRRTYGSPRVHAELRTRGQRVSRKRVVRLMRAQGLAARRRRRYVTTTDSRHRQPVAPNVLARDFSPAQPNTSWVTDITYVDTREGWLYLAVVLDLFSRKVVGWSMSDAIDRHLWCSVPWTWRSRADNRREGWCTTRTGAASTRVRSTSRPWRHVAWSAACRARAIAGTTPWWRASSAP